MEIKNVGKFTYAGNAGKSVVDYDISNPALFDIIRKFRGFDLNSLSYYCVVQFSLYRNTRMYTAQRKEGDSCER